MIYKSVHFVGIKGVGMTPLAIIAKEAGMKILHYTDNQKLLKDIEKYLEK